MAGFKIVDKSFFSHYPFGLGGTGHEPGGALGPETVPIPVWSKGKVSVTRTERFVHRWLRIVGNKRACRESQGLTRETIRNLAIHPTRINIAENTRFADLCTNF
jgi:hypothetical protein